MANTDDGRGKDPTADDVSIGFTECKASLTYSSLTYDKLLAAMEEIKKLPPVVVEMVMNDQLKKQIIHLASLAQPDDVTYFGIQIKVESWIPNWCIRQKYSDGHWETVFIKPEP